MTTDSAVQTLVALTSWQVWGEHLVIEQGWSKSRYRDRLTYMLEQILLET